MSPSFSEFSGHFQNLFLPTVSNQMCLSKLEVSGEPSPISVLCTSEKIWENAGISNAVLYVVCTGILIFPKKETLSGGCPHCPQGIFSDIDCSFLKEANCIGWGPCSGTVPHVGSDCSDQAGHSASDGWGRKAWQGYCFTWSLGNSWHLGNMSIIHVFS